MSRVRVPSPALGDEIVGRYSRPFHAASDAQKRAQARGAASARDRPRAEVLGVTRLELRYLLQREVERFTLELENWIHRLVTKERKEMGVMTAEAVSCGCRSAPLHSCATPNWLAWARRGLVVGAGGAG